MPNPPPPPVSSDPEFRPAFSDRAVPRTSDPGAYRRMLANPFLGILGVSAWLMALRFLMIDANGFAGRSALLCVGLPIAALLLPRLFHYHCLDCGRTGALGRWKRHVCPAVAQRIVEHRPRRRRGPPPMVQLLLWLFVFVAVLLEVRLGMAVSR